MTIGQGVIDGPTFCVQKEWVDPVPGIALVELHVTWGPPGEPPDWERRGDQAVMTLDAGGTAPGRRTAVVEVPRYVDGSTDYLLHHMFFVAGKDGRASSPVFTDEVTAAEVTYEDGEGRYTHVGLLWTVGASPQPNYSLARLDGLPFSASGVAETFAPVYEFVRAVPPPHTFRGRVWGLRGDDVTHAFHLVRTGSPRAADDTEEWADNDGQGWRQTL